MSQDNKIIFTTANTGNSILIEVKKLSLCPNGWHPTKAIAKENGTGLGGVLCRETIELNGRWVW